MDIARLIQMANQIGAFFQAEPDAAAARAGIADHLTRFWEPRMRGLILSHLEGEGGGEGLLPLVRDALVEHRERLTPGKAAS